MTGTIGKQRRHRVLVVVRWPIGGIHSWLRYVLRRKELASFEITVAAPELNGAEVLKESLSDAVRVDFLSCNLACFAMQVNKRILSRKYAVVHSHGFTAAAVCVLPAALSGTKHLMTQHEVILEDQFRTWRGRLVRWAIDFTLRRVDVVHSVSEAARSNLIDSFPALQSRRDRIVAVRNGIEVGQFRNAEAIDVRRELGLRRETLLIGFFGRFMSPKGFRHLIDAMEYLSNEEERNVRPVVVAFGSGGFRDREERSIRQKGLSGRFVFHGHTDNVAGFMKGMDIIAVPSQWEACGLVAMEALTAGVPLVVSNCGALVEVVDGSPALVIPRGDGAALASAIRRLSNVNIRPACEAYSAKAADRFGADRNAGGIADLYGRLLTNLVE